MRSMQEYSYQHNSGDSLSGEISINADTLKSSPVDTLRSMNSDSLPNSSSLPAELHQEKTIQIITASASKNIVNVIHEEESEAVNIDSIKSSEALSKSQNFSLFYQHDEKISFKPESIWTETQSVAQNNKLVFTVNEYQRVQLNWTLVIGILSLFLLVFLKTYYQKFVSKVMNTMVNFQLADTMLREKNSVVKRAFLIMNLNFVLIFSLFILLIAEFYNIRYYINSVQDYLLILTIVTGILIGRLVLYYAIAYIFEWMPAVLAQIHNNFLINKNLGLLLLPLVFIAIYTSPIYSKWVLFFGIGIALIATVFRLIRGFQIIIKNGVLLFYAILYLCTLELLPIVIGSKLIILLR